MNELLPTLTDAIKFAAKKHEGHKRKGAKGEPYITHLVEVAMILSTTLEKTDTNLLAAALLHDVIEDTDTSTDELVECFNDDVASLVNEVTDDKSLTKTERKQEQILRAPSVSDRACHIKIADKVSNLYSILEDPPLGWPLERKIEYFLWADKVVNNLSAKNPKLIELFEKVYLKGRQELGF